MIDIDQETPLSFAQAAKLKHMPIRRGGKCPHAATLWRWALHGVRGVKLESIVCGGVRCTSAEAIGRFFQELTHGSNRLAVRSPIKRRRAAEKAIAELERAGV